MNEDSTSPEAKPEEPPVYTEVSADDNDPIIEATPSQDPPSETTPTPVSDEAVGSPRPSSKASATSTPAPPYPVEPAAQSEPDAHPSEETVPCHPPPYSAVSDGASAQVPKPYPVQPAGTAAQVPKPYPVQPAGTAAQVPKPYPVQPGSYIEFVPFALPMIPSGNYTLKQTEGFVIADFLPRCLKPGRKGTGQLPEFEPFSSLVRQANHWLSENPGNRVFRCESVEMDADYSGVIKGDSCVQMESGHVMNIYVRILRLWCRQMSDGSGVPHQLWYVNVIPACRQEGKPLDSVSGSTAPFEGIAMTMEKLNFLLSKSPLPGMVLTVEQVQLTLSASSPLGSFNLDESCWEVNPERRHHFLSCIRVFYVLEDCPVFEKVGVLVIPPKGIVKPLCRSQWMTFNEVMATTAKFLLSDPNVRVTNIQTVKYPTDVRQYKEGPIRELKIDVDESYQSIGKNSTIVFAQWVGYTIRSVPAPVFTSGQITCRTFVPFKTSGNTYEAKGDCLNRISTWMKSTNNRLVTAETCSIYHNPRNEVIHFEKMSYDNVEGTLKHRVTLFRLYFDGESNAAPGFLVLQPPTQKSSAACNLL